MTARDCPSNLMNAMRLFKKGNCISTHWFGDINAILVTDKKGIAHKLFGAISCLIARRIAQFRLKYNTIKSIINQFFIESKLCNEEVKKDYESV